MGYLVEMINNNEIELNQFFTMHPFSASEKMIYDLALKEIDFFEELYIKNNKTYERLATVCRVINNAAKNLVVITGYRGCGKTNFLHLIKYICDGDSHIETLRELRDVELHYAKNIDDLKCSINTGYKESITNISNTFFGSKYTSEDDISGKKFTEYLSLQLSGKCKYINFDEGGMGREKPFSTKLFYSIRESVDKYEKEGRLFLIVRLIDDFVKRNQWIIEENFENIDFRTLKKFWKAVSKKIFKFQGDDFYDEFLEELKKLSLEQLLFVYTIWEYAEILTANISKTDRKLIYLLDNIDIISDGATDIFQNTMMGIWKFMWDTRNVFAKIRERDREEDRKFIELYDKTKIIVAMRETTAMHISGHLRDKMRGIMDHFDMSADVDKTIIMQRKIEYALSLIKSGEVESERFIDAINCINHLISDRLFMRNIFQLFNNDYRTATMCITTICIEHLDDVKKTINLIQTGKDSNVFGGRGILYRLIIDSFFGWDYFDAMGISSIKSKGHTIVLQTKYGYSCMRIILTILCNKQAKKAERFFINPEESVKLADLYGMVQELMNLDEFVNIINGMYSLRNKKFWNHLVTFDNILSYSPEVIKRYIGIESNTSTEDTDIYIRATSAGQMFASVICTHFEYFASRFVSTNKNVSLFLLDNLDDGVQWLSMKKIISDVYGAVENCIVTLSDYNRLVMKIKNANHYDQILESPYYYEKQFHEERIVHNHISYLESYRNFIFGLNMSDSRLAEVNSYLLTYMKKYLDLLKYDRGTGIKRYRGLFFTLNSKNLFNELNVCIEEIQKSASIRNSIEVTREYYMMNYKGRKCAFLRNRENIDG